MENQKSYQFCLDILQLGVRNNKALANTIMALAADTQAGSPVELSAHPLFHYQNTSVSKSIASLATSAEGWSSTELGIQHLVQLHLSREMIEQPVLHLQTDTTPVPHPHSPTLEDKGYIYVPNNMVRGNKPLNIGYRVSAVHIGEAQSRWSLPLSIRRVGTGQGAMECAVGQIDQLFDPLTGILPLREGQLAINDADTGYAHPAYVAPLHRHKDLVNIVRLHSGSKVWDADPRSGTGGAPRVYAETPLYLRSTTQQSTFRRGGKTWTKVQHALGEEPASDGLVLERTTKAGRTLHVHLRRWNDKMWRSKKGHNMHDKPLDILSVEVRDATSGKALYKNPLWLGMMGVRKDQVTAEMFHESYGHRYDIEPAFRIEKQHLMLGKYQPLNVRHFDNWLLIVLLSFWLLFTASDEVEYVPKKWQQYPLGEAEQKRQQAKRWSPAQTKKAAQRLFCTFDQAPFMPQTCKKGKGRQKGDTQVPRPRFPVVKKGTKMQKIKLKSEKRE